MIRTNKDVYMTIWSVEERDGKYKGRASTSRKNKDNTYVNSNWNVSFVKDAAEKAATLKERDRIVIKPGDLSIENILLPEREDRKATSYLYVTIYNFERPNQTNEVRESASTTNNDELPF